MTKKLEDLLNLPDSKEIIEQAEAQEADQKMHEIEEKNKTMRDIAEFDKISSALPAVKGLGEMADKELNDIADKAMQAYEDLMDLGMNVESRYASRVFEVAGGMLKTTLDAKTAKLDKKYGYNYEAAKAAGIQPDETGHWGSIGNDGLILKGPKHPSMVKTKKVEGLLGNKIVKRGGNQYSVPKK